MYISYINTSIHVFTCCAPSYIIIIIMGKTQLQQTVDTILKNLSTCTLFYYPLTIEQTHTGSIIKIALTNVTNTALSEDKKRHVVRKMPTSNQCQGMGYVVNSIQVHGKIRTPLVCSARRHALGLSCFPCIKKYGTRNVWIKTAQVPFLMH